MQERLDQLLQQQAGLRLQLDEVTVLINAYNNAIAKQKEEAKDDVEKTTEKENAEN